MRLVVLSNEMLRGELLGNGVAPDIEITWSGDVGEFARYKDADVYVDLLFDNTKKRIELLNKFSSRPVIINFVAGTLVDINAPFIRINAWPGFLKRQVVEASYGSESLKKEAERVFNCLNKRMEWVPDVPGFITARVIAMMINEAWFALEEGVSTKEEIDTAMKLGTNYPYGPFEWGDQIGIKNVCALLDTVSKTNDRYQPASLMKKQVKE